MNAEQKQQAQQAIEGWQSVRNDDPMKPAGDVLAALLQELVEAPEPEPVAWNVEGKGGETMCVTDNKFAADRYIACGYVVEPLYTAPPAPSVPDGWRLVPETATVEMRNAGMAHLTGLTSYANSMALKVYGAMLAAAPQPPKLSDEGEAQCTS